MTAQAQLIDDIDNAICLWLRGDNPRITIKFKTKGTSAVHTILRSLNSLVIFKGIIERNYPI